jgi:hypothetical protein
MTFGSEGAGGGDPPTIIAAVPPPMRATARIARRALFISKPLTKQTHFRFSVQFGRQTSMFG